MKDYKEKSLQLHKEYKGKLTIDSKIPLENRDDLSLAYSPGVAAPCLEIQKNKDMAYDYTIKNNLVAVITDGSAVLGLGNIGSDAAMPVMEGKSLLFKKFGNIDSFPIGIKTQDPDEFINIVKNISTGFGGINLEDIASPNCIYIEKRLKEELDIPVFHDDQHGTAVVTIAALINALKILNKNINDITVLVNGAGAAGIAIIRMLDYIGVKHIIALDKSGVINKSRSDLHPVKKDILHLLKESNGNCNLESVIKDVDVFIGVSVGNVLTKDMVKSMAQDPIIFALANPIPEIDPDDAKQAGASIVGTGRSDFNNQINNILAFPGIFRGTLDARAIDINMDMKIAAAYAIANFIPDNELNADYIIPDSLDKRVAEKVSEAVFEKAVSTGVARLK